MLFLDLLQLSMSVPHQLPVSPTLLKECKKVSVSQQVLQPKTEVTERIAVPERTSARTIYQSKWSLFET